MAAPFSITFPSNFFLVFEAKLFINLVKLSLAKGIGRSVSAFFLNYLTQDQNLDLDISTLLGFISVDKLLAKEFLILVVSLVVKNNSRILLQIFYLLLILLLFYFLLQILI